LVPQQVQHLADAGLELDLARREMRVRGVVVPLGNRAFDILEVLAGAAGELVGKDDLMQRIWPGAIVEENTLQVHISAIRKALGAERSLLQTTSGRGYRLLGHWQTRRDRPAAERPAVAAVPPSPVPLRRNNFPAPMGELIGRAPTVQRLRDLLSAYRAVTLTGPGGIGKTALALEVARGLFPEFQGEGCLVELAALADAALVPSAVAAALGLTLAGDAVSAEAVARAIGDRRLILVLDNCEHVVDGAAGLAETIVRLCPRVSVLATSREVLRIDGELVYRVPPLEVPPDGADAPSDPLAHSAVQLFLARARAFGVEFAPDRQDLPGIAAICRHLDGIPLAIEFAAARAAALGVRQVEAGLADRFGLLTRGRRTALPRHQTLRATFDWSYQLLPPEEAAMLRRLAIFAGDFSLDAAIAVGAGGAAGPAVATVANLVSKSLVVADFGSEPTRYRLLETIRLYAVEKLRREDDFRDAARSHAEYYKNLLAPAEAESEARLQAEWLATYGQHLDNVRAGLDWAFSPDGDAELGVSLTITAVPLWLQLALLEECRERVQRALAAIDGGAAATPRQRMQLYAALGWSLLYGVGRAREAGAALARTLELAESLDDRSYRLRALWGLCIDQINSGQFRAALDLAQRFADLAAASTDPVDMLLGDRLLATASHYFGDQNRARRHIDRVVTQLAALAGQPQIVRLRFDMRVSSHYFQARILWLQGAAEEALRIVEQTIEEGQAIGHALTFCSVLGQGACPIAFLAGNLDAAARYGAMLLDHTERNPIRLWRIWAQCFAGLIAIERGDIAGGLGILRRELEAAGEAKFLPRFLLLLGELAMGLGKNGEVAQGLQTVEDALDRCKARDEGWYLAELLRIKGELLLRSGADAAAAAESCFAEAAAVAREQGALFWELRTALSRARLRPSEARSLLAPMLDRFPAGTETADLRSARALFASR
jgi:predicted ATPase/DNA-binding winged helix-turn-helix (wHTH) protein